MNVVLSHIHPIQKAVTEIIFFVIQPVFDLIEQIVQCLIYRDTRIFQNIAFQLSNATSSVIGNICGTKSPKFNGKEVSQCARSSTVTCRNDLSSVRLSCEAADIGLRNSRSATNHVFPALWISVILFEETPSTHIHLSDGEIFSANESQSHAKNIGLYSLLCFLNA